MLIRKLLKIILLPLVLLFFLSSTVAAEEVLHHDLAIKVDLANGEISVTDTVTLPEPRQSFAFQLNNQLIPSYNGQRLSAEQEGKRFSFYQVPLHKNETQLTLNYTGKLPSTQNCRFTLDICSLLNEDGIYLNPAIGWYPMNADLQTFNIRIELPETWLSLSQGQEVSPNHWQIDKPQDAIYLLAGKFKRYESEEDNTRAQVYLLNDDPELAERYLKATHHYLQHYQNLLGDYPYKKFATVESFWETGWGMPSFTLLGSRVMRMPFILHTSFPHEILHNWWGNGVYVDSSLGNWSEGLTAYLSDHALQKSTGKDIAYRRTALNKYAVFTQGENDFPIQQFRSRHSEATQAIGYSKLLMVFHMLRKDVGDTNFFAGLQNFYRDYQFKHASMNDLVASLSKSSQRDLRPFFHQWTTKPDAPTIHLQTWKKTPEGISLTLRQVSSQEPFNLKVHVTAYDDHNEAIWQQIIELKEAKSTYTLNPPETTHKLAIDPGFDVLRKPLKEEIPPNLHSFRDPTDKTIMVTGTESWWQAIAEKMTQIVPQASLDNPKEQTQTIIQLGLEKHFKKQVLSIDTKHYRINERNFARETHTLVFAHRKPEQLTSIIIDSPDEEAAYKAINKLRHYGKYSYLIFDKNGKNVAKGEWATEHSPLTISLKND